MLHDSPSSSSQLTSVSPVLSAVPVQSLSFFPSCYTIEGGPWAHLFWGGNESKSPSRKIEVRLGKGTDLNSRCCHAGGGGSCPWTVSQLCTGEVGEPWVCLITCISFLMEKEAGCMYVEHFRSP